jgi:hypothetical protein
MAITAMALLRIPNLPALAGRVKALEDAVLFYTGADFATDPAALARLVREQLGEETAGKHVDPRGIFFVPHVAAPAARNYEAVIAEVGEGGVWAPPADAFSPLGSALAGGSLGALLGGLLEQMPSSVLESVGAAARGEPGALQAASAQLQAAMAGSVDLSQLAGTQTPPAAGEPALDIGQLAAMLQGSGVDVQRLASEFQSALARDPAAAALLAEKFFGSADEDDDEESPK